MQGGPGLPPSPLDLKKWCNFSGGFRGGGALGASAPPAESMVKNRNLPFFLLNVG